MKHWTGWLTSDELLYLAQCRDDTMKNENAVKEAVRSTMLQAGAMDLGGVPMGLGRTVGVADQRWLCHGQLFAIECKWDVRQRQRPTVAQTAYLRGVDAHGGYGLVIDRTNYRQLDVLLSGHRRTPQVLQALRYLSIEWCPKDIKQINLGD